MAEIAESSGQIVIHDITSGREVFPIPVRVAYGSVQLSDPFRQVLYLRECLIREEVRLNFSVHAARHARCRYCVSDCLVGCVCISKTTGCVPAYAAGLLSPAFLAASIQSKLSGKIPPFIKECWVPCSCPIDCGNRLVQRGMANRFHLYSNDQELLCVRNDEMLPMGSYLFEFTGELIYKSELALDKTEDHLMDKTEDHLIVALDADPSWNESNVIDVPVLIERNLKTYYHVALFARCDLQPNTILLWDFNADREAKRKTKSKRRVKVKKSARVGSTSASACVSDVSARKYGSASGLKRKSSAA